MSVEGASVEEEEVWGPGALPQEVREKGLNLKKRLRRKNKEED